MKRSRRFTWRATFLLVAAIGGVLVWTGRADILQWGVNRTVEALENVDGVRTYIDRHRTEYLTEREARIDVAGTMHAASRADLAPLRARVTEFIWGGPLPADRLPDDVAEVPDIARDYDLSPLARIRAFVTGMAHGVSVRTLFLETAASPRGCLVVYHQDHNAVLLGEREWFRRFLAAGCDVISVPLPLTVDAPPLPIRTEVDGRLVELSDHNDFAALERDGFTPIRFFVEPAVASVNRALSEKSYDRIGVLGLSGGSWATMLHAAIDPRVSHAYPVAGALPLYLRYPGSRNRGDWEGRSSALYDLASYFDLYLLGVLEPGRRAIYVYNRYDNCCSNGVLTAAFSAQTEGIARRWGLGSIRFHIDETARVHIISEDALDLIMSDFLK